MLARIIFAPARLLPFEVVILALGFALAPFIAPLFSPLYWYVLGHALGI